MSCMERLVVSGTFGDAQAARRALDALAQEGFLPGRMRIEPAAAPSAGDVDGQRGSRASAPRVEREGLLHRFLGRARQGPEGRAEVDRVAGRACVLVVETSTQVTAERAATVMEECGGRDLAARGGVQPTHAGREVPLQTIDAD